MSSYKIGLLFCLLAACGSAERKASEVLGSDIECISSSRNLAYCTTLSGRGYLCDLDKCVPMTQGQAERVMMLLEDDRQRDEDETTMMIMTNNNLMMMQ